MRLHGKYMHHVGSLLKMKTTLLWSWERLLCLKVCNENKMNNFHIGIKSLFFYETFVSVSIIGPFELFHIYCGKK